MENWIHKVGTIGAKLWTLCKKVEKLGYPLNASDFQKFWELCAQQLSISGIQDFFLMCSRDRCSKLCLISFLLIKLVKL